MPTTGSPATTTPTPVFTATCLSSQPRSATIRRACPGRRLGMPKQRWLSMQPLAWQWAVKKAHRMPTTACPGIWAIMPEGVLG